MRTLLLIGIGVGDPDHPALITASPASRLIRSYVRHDPSDKRLTAHPVTPSGRYSTGRCLPARRRRTREGLELVVGPPFDAAGYDWAHRDQDVAEACTLIEHATERLVELALDTGLVDVARDAIVRGLRGLPGNEELYRCRMRVEHHGGNLPGVSAAYEELVTYLADLETEPSTSTTALYQDLVRPVGR